MGVIAYRIRRTNTDTGEDIGEIAILFPQINEQFNIGTGYKTMSDLLQYSDFPVEAHVFVVGDDAVERFKNFGFGNTIDMSKYYGETWFLDNGSYIKITPYNSSGTQGELAYYLKDSSSFLLTNVAQSDSGIFLISLVGSDVNETAGVMSNYYMSNSGTNKGKILAVGGNGDVPVRISIGYYRFFEGANPIYISNDPYADGGVSETGGGTGTFSDKGTNIEIPELPTLSATEAGFITLFNPSLDELRNLASYMWSDLFDINGWKKVFADPMNAILGLSIVPVNVPTSGTKPVKVGNISTDVSMTVASSQYVELDCGTLDIKEFWGAYLDYDPYTKAELYLPYIGTHAISVDDIMGKSVRIVYHIDILSGACCAYIQCDGTVLYSFIGQCTSSIPITGDNWASVINGALSIASSVGTMVATGGASAPMSIGQIASTAVNTMKPNIEKSGAMGGTGGLMGVQTPYLIITRPRQALPGDQNQFIGYPSFITKKLSALSGYTEVESIHLENVPATESELVEIENLLNGGVIF